MPKIFLLLRNESDGCTYSADHIIGVYDDETVAGCFALDLNEKYENTYQSFSVNAIQLNAVPDLSFLDPIGLKLSL